MLLGKFNNSIIRGSSNKATSYFICKILIDMFRYEGGELYV